MKKWPASLALASLLSLPMAAAAEMHAQIGNWLVVCQDDTSGYCTANAKVRSAPGAQQSYAFQLHVWRAREGEALRVTFLAGTSKPGEGESMQWRVDAHLPVTFQAETGYRSIRSSSSYALSGGEALTELLAQMLDGKHLQIAYRDAQGNPVAASFSLGGLRPALSRFDRAAVDQLTLTLQAAASARKREPVSRQTKESAIPAEPPALAESSVAPEPVARGESAPPPAAVPTRTEQPAASASPTTSNEPSQTAALTRAALAAPSTMPRSRRGKHQGVRQFACNGQDPAWSLAIDQQQAKLELIGTEPAREWNGKFSLSGEGRTPIMTWRGKGSGKQHLTAVIVEQSCIPSASETEALPFQTDVTLPDGRKVHGCCTAIAPAAQAAGVPEAQAASVPPGLQSARIADFAAKSIDDWARPLLDLKEAIDACLAKTPGPSPYVTKAWQLDTTLAGVRTRGGDGGWFGCIARLDGSLVDRFEMLPRNELPLPGENLTLFTPAGGTPRTGNCWVHERVLDPTGTLLGFLSYNNC